MKKIFNLCLFLFLCIHLSTAQVHFQLDWNQTEEIYVVSMKSDQTWESPLNMTSNAQITIKVPSGDFEVINFNNLIETANFEANSRHNAPSEAPEFDYISFGLTNLGAYLPYQQGQTIPIFSFQNGGDCNGSIELVNESDEFLPPNSAKANIGNYISVLGAQGDAYAGIEGEGVADCNLSTNTNQASLINTQFEVFPNPFAEKINLKFNWQEAPQEMELNFYDSKGKNIKQVVEYFSKGENTLAFDLEDLQSGLYSIEISGNGMRFIVDRVFKLN